MMLFIPVFDMGSSGYNDFVWAVELHRFSLELVGLWPVTEVSEKKLWLNVRASFVYMIIIFIGIPLIWALVRVWGDMMLMIDNLRFTLPFIAVLFKFVVIRWKQRVLQSILNMTAEDWLALKLNTERNVMLKRARSVRLLLIFGYIIMILGIFVEDILPFIGIQFTYRHTTNLTDRNKPLLFPGYYIYDTDKSPLFELTILAQMISCVIATVIYISVDALLGFLIFHICGQLENFRHHLINLILCKNFYQALNNCVMYHLRLIRFAKNIESTFSLMMLGLVFYFCIAFCLCGFLFVNMINDQKINDISILQACYLIIFALLLLSQTFLYCGAGELLTGQCEAVHHTICDLEWYKLESRKLKNLIFLIIRTNEPFRITAGKIIPLTMATFCSLLKTSVGYITFLLSKKT